MKKKLVVIGNGMAGARVAEEILALASDKFEIVMFGAEPYGNYNRILLSNVLNQTQSPQEIFINPLTWYQENHIVLHRGVKAFKIDRDCRVVIGKKLAQDDVPYAAQLSQSTDELIEEPYDHVIIATGSRPFVPPLTGADQAGVFQFRTIDDCAKIAEYARGCQRAVVIGGGLLGLEAARGLMTHDVEVTVLEAAPQLMPAQLDLEAAHILKRTMEAMGVRVMTGQVTSEIIGEGGRIRGLKFQDGSELLTDMLVISAGIRPITEIAVASGLKVNKGIVCDDQMRTSDPDIFSVGECVEHRGVLYGLVEPIWEQTRVVAEILSETGKDASYVGSKIGTKLKVMGVELMSLGEKNPSQPNDEVIIYRDPNRGIYKKMIVRDDKILGVILLGDTELADNLMRMFKNQVKVPENRAEILFGSVPSTGLIDVRDLPDGAQVCNCNGVCKKTIVDAITEKQCTSVAAVGQATKAGKGCGSCRGLIAQIIEAAVGEVLYDTSEHYYVPGVPLEKSQLMREVRNRGLKSVSAVFRELADGKEHVDSKVGLASLLKIIWPKDYEDERDARFINDRVHANIQKDGTFSVVPRIYGGVTSPDELMRIAQVAQKYHVPMVKITGGQRIDLLGIKKEDLPHVWKDLGMPSGHAYTKSFRTCKSCVGSDFCRYGVGDSISLAQKIEYRFQGIESPHKMKLAATGCPRNCAEAYVKDIGAVAIEGGKWEIYVGGAAGSTVRKGDLLCTVDTHEDVLQQTGRFIQYYREHAKYLERTYGFVERIGIDVLKSILIEDSLGICSQLDERIQEAVDAYKDPWKEAENPAYPEQFEGPKMVEVINMAESNG
ncbi:MAG: nitrite reductase large subunit NirB [Candidatus Omnitrophica bacterium]|nr:nitrite reductase large subunit NirB [Candidatus Omnitrophota bacterium]